MYASTATPFCILLVAAFSAGCAVEYGRARLPFSAPTLVPVTLACQPHAEARAELNVTVSDSNGEVIPGAVLVLVALPERRRLGSVVSGIQGQASFSNLPLGAELELRAQLEGFFPRRSRFKIASPGTCSFTLNLELGIPITVTQLVVPVPKIPA